MVRLGPATFSMGTDESELPQLMARYPGMPRDMFESELPRRVVRLSAFRIDRYEVTNAQYREFLLANPSWLPTATPPPESNGSYLKDWSGATYPSGEARRPVTYITWYAAEAYCWWRGGRLPTEAEWEYAASGGLDRPEFPWGNDAPTATSANWSDSGINRPIGVGQFTPNGYGLYDMAGNVWEYTADRWPDNPSKPAEIRYAIRGGSYGAAPVNLRVRYRDSHPALGAGPHVGFRCAE
jgi:formylglycine-generating enzyme